jgi:D-glycero-alpha-D-manno-heptose 1-phosphate guanylyltransferase
MGLTAIILAGGFGTRLKDIVPDIPKPMAPILGRPFLEYLMDYWIKQGVSHFIMSVGYQKQVIMSHFLNQYNGVTIEYSIEDSPLGTGGGLLKASKNLTDSFLLLNGDTFIEVDLNEMIDFHFNKKSDWTLSIIKLNQTDRYMGIEMDDNGKIISFNSTKGQNFQIVNGGVYLINPSIFKNKELSHDINVSLEDELLPEFSASGGNLFGVECLGKFIDIGVPEDYLRAHEILIN